MWVAWATTAAALAGDARLAAAESLAGDYLHFQYDFHGEDWQYGQCSSRERQSPVDFASGWSKAPEKTVYFDYAPVTEFIFANNGHGVAADFAAQGMGGLVWDATLPQQQGYYTLLSVNIHAQSEHTFRGKRTALEVHLVHKLAGGGALVVVAVPIEAGGAALAAFEDPPPKWTRRLTHNATDLNALLEGGVFFAYDGSLTVPPCAETVVWLVRREPVLATQKAVAALTDAILETTSGFGNFRATLPLRDRRVQIVAGMRGKPPANVSYAPPPRERKEVFEAARVAREAERATQGANAAVRFLDNKLRRAATGNLYPVQDTPAEAPQAPLAARAAAVAASTLRSMEDEIGRHVQGVIA